MPRPPPQQNSPRRSAQCKQSVAVGAAVVAVVVVAVVGRRRVGLRAVCLCTIDGQFERSARRTNWARRSSARRTPAVAAGG